MEANEYAVSDENGYFIIKNVQKDLYQIKISASGFKIDTQTIEISKNIYLDITLIEEVESLEDIIVYAKTASEKQNEKAITINSLDVKKNQNQSLGTEEVLKTSTGVVVRKSGGLGSAININLNGLSGNAVPIYYDGIPLEVYGNGLQLNSIPVDALERVDIYKGVMPIDIGTDALGGGINLVPLKQNKDYLRTSYSIGSFNTHRVSFTGLKNINKKMSLSTISYLNYSDNDYSMDNIPSLLETELPDDSPGVTEEHINIKRFHNKHVSGFIEVKLHIRNLKWADQLKFSSSYFGGNNELQHGAFIVSRAIGEAEVEANTFAQRIDYQKSFFNDKLKTRYYGVLSTAFDKVNDSTANVYNWRGERLNIINETGAEISSTPTLRERENLGTAHRFILGYKITDNIEFKISDFYRYTNIKGKDAIGERVLINNELIDLNRIPSKVNRNIFGAEINTNLFENKLNVIAFFKNYDYKSESIDFSQLQATILPIREIENNTNGYGFALKYQINPTIFIRTNFEQAIRIPTEIEVFGNLATISPNFELKPEESLNWNVGADFNRRFKNNKLIALNINGFIRDQKNLIRVDQSLADIDNIQFVNEVKVSSKGVELGVQIVPLKNLSFKGNFTYQSNKIGSTDIEVPNTPLNFYNIATNYEIENIFKSENNLELFWTYFFTNKFSINQVVDLDTANPDFIIPKQKIHNTGVTYIMKKKGLAFSFNLQNIFNTEVFDNFRIPRPGINYAFKINYSL